jgi:hypothetical protein
VTGAFSVLDRCRELLDDLWRQGRLQDRATLKSIPRLHRRHDIHELDGGHDCRIARLERLGHPDKATTLMIGDSLASDIQGGNDYGIDTCWYTPNTEVVPTPSPTYRVGSLAEIPAVVKD